MGSVLHFLRTLFVSVSLGMFVVKSVIAKDIFLFVHNDTTGFLHCPQPARNITITWKHPLYKPPCVFSVTDITPLNFCLERVMHENQILKVLNTQINGIEKYSCQVVDAAGKFNFSFMLQELVPPSVSLTINPAGFPECRAVGGIPAAEISWNPESDNVTTRREMAPDTTWTVISTYRAQIIPGREVTCNVSHPTFTHPQILCPGSPPLWWIAIPVVLLVMLGLMFCCRRLIFRTCSRMRRKQEHKEELEPYASFVQKVNTIYVSVPRS